MSSVPLHYVELRTFCYATEDVERVATALETLLPEDADVEGVETEGHYGDPIVVLSTRLEGTDEVRAVLVTLRNLPQSEYDRLLDELDERIDEETNLFVTLDKQAAYEGAVRLGDGITLRGKVEAYPAKHDTAVENAREFLETA
jgi:RNA binding exosome subunit